LTSASTSIVMNKGYIEVVCVMHLKTIPIYIHMYVKK